MLKVFRKEGEKGFTLIELMIVIAIIGILAAIAIPQFMQYRKKAYVATLNSDCKNAFTASVAYFVDSPYLDFVTLAKIKNAGYSQSNGVGTEITPGNPANQENYTIRCFDVDNAWVVDAAFVVVKDGTMTMTSAKIPSK